MQCTGSMLMNDIFVSVQHTSPLHSCSSKQARSKLGIFRCQWMSTNHGNCYIKLDRFDTRTFFCYDFKQSSFLVQSPSKSGQLKLRSISFIHFCSQTGSSFGKSGRTHQNLPAKGLIIYFSVPLLLNLVFRKKVIIIWNV